MLHAIPRMEKWKQYLQGARDPFPWRVYPDFEDETQHGLELQRKAFEEKMEKLLGSVGFDYQLVEVATKVDAFRDEESFKQHVAQWLDYRQLIPKEQRDAFMDDVIGLYRKAVEGVTFCDESHYTSDIEEGVRIETAAVRILATRPKPFESST